MLDSSVPLCASSSWSPPLVATTKPLLTTIFYGQEAKMRERYRATMHNLCFHREEIVILVLLARILQDEWFGTAALVASLSWYLFKTYQLLCCYLIVAVWLFIVHHPIKLFKATKQNKQQHSTALQPPPPPPPRKRKKDILHWWCCSCSPSHSCLALHCT